MCFKKLVYISSIAGALVNSDSLLSFTQRHNLSQEYHQLSPGRPGMPVGSLVNEAEEPQ